MVLRTYFKTQHVFALLLVCLFALASVACLIHTDVEGETPVAHDGHRHPSASSSMQSLPDLHCLMAVLPAVIMLVWFYLGILYSLTRFSLSDVFSFPPFIPPKVLLPI